MNSAGSSFVFCMLSCSVRAAYRTPHPPCDLHARTHTHTHTHTKRDVTLASFTRADAFALFAATNLVHIILSLK